VKRVQFCVGMCSVRSFLCLCVRERERERGKEGGREV
jgi:hypothetical protein